MIIADTSIWIDHLRTTDPTLVRLLESDGVLGHPWVIGELALGHLRRRGEILSLLAALPRAMVATPAEILHLVDQRELAGRRIGYVDAQLVAATLLTPGARLWTRDRRLAGVAEAVGRAFRPERLEDGLP